MISVLRTDGEWEIFPEANRGEPYNGTLMIYATNDHTLAGFPLQHVRFWLHGDARERQTNVGATPKGGAAAASGASA